MKRQKLELSLNVARREISHLQFLLTSCILSLSGKCRSILRKSWRTPSAN